MQYVSDIFTMLSRTASTYICGSGSGVEHHLAKVRVAGSNLVFRSNHGKNVTNTFFFCAQMRFDRVQLRRLSSPSNFNNPPPKVGKYSSLSFTNCTPLLIL